MKKDLAIIIGLFLLIVALLIFGKGFTTASLIGPGNNQNQRTAQKNKVSLNAKSLSINATVVTAPGERKKGLSKLDLLPLTEGMLFVFEKSGLWGFWMKDMKFAIDIIWIDGNKNIVDIAKNVPPEPDDKDRELTVYKPKVEAMYVLEINAGLSDFNNLEIGDAVNFTL
ncbi:hypothetical protein A2693_01685 [Candidatus Curtissbacteria bacterium RIFCSPHIGHO2_01_FULL_40_12]|uniref:DUF192 domain-containing protein n=1 Tax=Candidatus Curtissbacteria bacterium RIFCSPHIGHO2_01_FULL_40_12 TaxID=1797710 RepID=A0A1F5G740_9BACT|nr:MAG: hypothetical protein A2693_01685 [Candidatus Curtissbacteria bacterium RIFCSPHIGHO2_01_FULL_40_12]